MSSSVEADAQGSARDGLAERLDIEWKRPERLDEALTHRSYAYEHEIEDTNERLELLGDAVLSLVVADMLFKRFPDAPEGDLAKLRASLVSAPALAGVARELGIGEAVRLGHGEELTGGREKPSILADTLEAVVGAIYLDRGITTARRVIRRLFGERVRSAVGRAIPKDAKTHLQELATRRHGELPEYATDGEGPDHEKWFLATVRVAGEPVGEGRGRSKKAAEQAAAAEALVRLEEEGEA